MHHHPRLLVVAHGTHSPEGLETTRRLVDGIADARRDVAVQFCFLDVASPKLPDVLAADELDTVIVPLLLSTGYHVQADIPAAARDRPGTWIGRHLGPHPLLVDALLDRLPAWEPKPSEGDDRPTEDGPTDGGLRNDTDTDTDDESVTVLVGAGSSRSEARDELLATAAQLSERVGGRVDVLTMADDLSAALRSYSGSVRVATYLLAEGQFVTTLESAAAGVAAVGGPLGVHPALVELVWSRYDDALGVAETVS